MNQEWNEMRILWGQADAGGADVDQILRYVERLERSIRWRGRVAVVCGVVGVCGAVAVLSHVQSPVEFALGLSVAAFVVGMMLQIRLKGWFQKPVDRSLSRSLFRVQLEERFASRIQVFRLLKYWFAVPLVVTGGVTAWALAAGVAGQRDLLFVPLIAAGSALGWWFNEGVAVEELRQEWERVRRALDGGGDCL